MDNSLYPTSKSKFHSGFVAILGKPNVGKSTLVNNLVGGKVSIVSSKPQTTRHRVLGVKTGKDYQLVFIDTPGVHEPRDQLGKYMEKSYREEVRNCDLSVLMVDLTHPPTDEDRRGVETVKSFTALSTPNFLVMNKVDAVDEDKRIENGKQYRELDGFDRVFEISALEGTGLDELIQSLISHLPEGPAYFPTEMRTDQSLEFTAAEIVREKILLKTYQEVPHSVFVHTEQVREDKNKDTLYFQVMIYVLRDGQKGIIIGKGGKMLKKIGTLAREELEYITGKKVFLDLWVKVKKDWKDRKDLLKAWGYEV